MAKKKSKAGQGKRTGPAGTAGAATSSGAIGPARAAKPRRKATKKKTAKKKPAAEAAEPAPVVAAGDSPSPPAALTRSSSAKRQAVLEAILPLTTSARMARLAEQAVWAISSDKTHEMLEAQDKADRALEERAEEALRQVAPSGPLDPALRRGSRDAFGFFRAELDRAEEDPADPHARWRTTSERMRHEVQPGATPERLAEVEERLGVQLPRSYYDFCLEWNGARLYTSEAGGYHVLPATGIVEEIKGALCNRMVRPYLPIVDLGCGDYLALDTERAGKGGEYPLVWWYGGEAKRRVAESFSQWLKRLVEGAGHPYWWDPPS